MVHTNEIATGVAIIGNTNKVRARPLPLKLLEKQTAAQTPNTSGAITEAAVKYSVRHTPLRNRSSWSIFA